MYKSITIILSTIIFILFSLLIINNKKYKKFEKEAIEKETKVYSKFALLRQGISCYRIVYTKDKKNHITLKVLLIYKDNKDYIQNLLEKDAIKIIKKEIILRDIIKSESNIKIIIDII